MSADWMIYDQRSNATGVYYTLRMVTTGTTTAGVTVKHSTRYDTHVCLTCNTIDCPHAKWLRKYLTREVAA